MFSALKTLIRERSLFMTGVGTEGNMVGVTEKISTERWCRRIIFDDRG